MLKYHEGGKSKYCLTCISRLSSLLSGRLGVEVRSRQDRVQHWSGLSVSSLQLSTNRHIATTLGAVDNSLSPQSHPPLPGAPPHSVLGEHFQTAWPGRRNIHSLLVLVSCHAGTRQVVSTVLCLSEKRSRCEDVKMWDVLLLLCTVDSYETLLPEM